MTDPVVIQWDSASLPVEIRSWLPEGLRGLPPGRYLIEPFLDDDDLTSEEEHSLLQAMQEIEAGQGVPWEHVRGESRNLIAE